MFEEQWLAGTDDRVPVVTQVELFVGFASVALINGDEFVMARILLEERTWRKERI